MLLSRRHLLYAMLGALALAAASGVLAIFIADSEVAWRVAGTALVAAAAAAIMMPMASWADKPASRLAGLCGMSISVVELLLASLIIWGDIFSSTTREFLMMSGVILAVCGLTGVRFLKEIRSKGWEATARVGAGACVGSGAILLLAAYQESFSPSGKGGEFAETGIAFFFGALVASIALVGLEKRDRAPWRWVGVAAAAAAVGITTYGVWMKTHGDPAWPTAAYALAAIVSHAILCLRVTLPGWQRWVRVLAIGAGASTGVLAVFSAHESFNSAYYEYDAIWRTATGAGLIAISASLALVVFARLNKRPAIELRKSTLDRVSLVCPRCQRQLTLPVGGALCDGCKLHINVTVLNTQCATCGYDLSDLHADKCPECGTPIPASVAGLTETQ